MHFSSRVLSELERGLISQLRFSFVRMGARELRGLRIGDPVTLEVRLHNDSGLPLTEIRGTLRAGTRMRFPAATFELETLGARESATIATIEGIFRGPVDTNLVDDGLARVAVSTRIDLSHILFEEWDKPVTLAPELSSREMPTGRTPRPGRFGKGVPLSTP